MSSTNLPVDLPTDRAALDRALATVAEESFFAVVEPVPIGFARPEGPMLAARVAFEGTFTGLLCCRMPRSLAVEMTTAFTGEDAVDGPQVDDLAGEFANMLCGRWLTDVAPQSLFILEHPTVTASSLAEVEAVAPLGLLNGQPVWIELSAEG